MRCTIHKENSREKNSRHPYQGTQRTDSSTLSNTGVSASDGLPIFLKRKIETSKVAESSNAASIDFPYESMISSSLGQTVPGNAVHDPNKCSALGVEAFTDDTVTYFASKTPALHVAAHEATHQMQHAGVTRDANYGPESHANHVADTIVAGHSAKGLLGNNGSSVVSGLRPYTKKTEAQQKAEGQWEVGSDAKVGDAGLTVTTKMEGDCYAESSLIDSANTILKAKDSGIDLKKGSERVSGMAPDRSGWKTLIKLEHPKDKYWTDCGRASREVQGPTGSDSKTHGVYIDEATGERRETTAESSRDPEAFRNEIYLKGGLGHDLASARTAYLTLSADPVAKDAFDKKMGINRYAAPGVGESFTTRRDDALSSAGFNYHWGAVIMVAPPDRVTFENFYRPGTTYSSENTRWYFETFGPPSKPGQTFHDKNAGSGSPGDADYNPAQVGTLGQNTTTMVARTSPAPEEMEKLSTSELIKRYKAATTLGEKTVLTNVMGNRWIKVTVEVKEAQEGPDEVYAEAEHNGTTLTSGEIKLKTGQRNTFWFSVSKLSPITGEIDIRIYDADVFRDDLLSIIGFDAPYSPQTDNRPWDDAEYHTKVEFNR